MVAVPPVSCFHWPCNRTTSFFEQKICYPPEIEDGPVLKKIQPSITGTGRPADFTEFRFLSPIFPFPWLLRTSTVSFSRDVAT